MVLKCDERGFELLLTVNHYKYVLKFCNINHGMEARSRLEGGRRHRVTLKIENERQILAPIPCLPVRPSHPGGRKEALGVNPPNKPSGKQDAGASM